MKRDILRLSALLSGAAALSACSLLGHGEGYSRYGDYQPSSAGYYLRSAPQHSYHFAAQPRPYYGVETANTRFQPVPRYVYRVQPTTPQPVKFANNITHENGVMVHRPGAPVSRPAQTQTIRHIEMAPESVTTPFEYEPQETYVFDEVEAAPAFPFPVQPETMPETINDTVPKAELDAEPIPELEYEASSSDMSGVDISYVKINGSSDIADWEMCEAQTGGYVEWSLSGYKVDPAFDNCMRVKGYKPESEAAEDLAGGN